MTYPVTFLSDLQRLLEHEGGFADRPKSDDPGGFTGYGITLSTFNRYRALVGQEPVDKGVMKLLIADNVDMVRDIYYRLYWAKNSLDLVSPGLRYMLFDIAVLEGNKGIRRVQKEVGARQDGVVGPKTIQALKDKSMGFARHAMLLKTITDIRREYLRTRAHAAKNPGWFNRLPEVLEHSLNDAFTYWSDLRYASLRPFSGGDDIDNKETTMEDTKGQFESGTILASFIGLLLTAASIFGFEIPSGDIAIIKDKVNEIFLGILFVVTWVRRVKATKRIR